MTLYPLIHIGFTTDDDAKLAIVAGYPFFEIKEYALSSMKNTGRIFLLLNYPIAIFPYVFNNIVVLKFISIGSLVVAILSFCFVLNRIFCLPNLGLLLSVIYISFIQFSWQYNLLTSYLFSFNFSIIVFTLSLFFLNKYLCDQSKKYLLFSSFLYFLALSIYENYVLYFLFFILIAFIDINNETSSDIKKKIVRFFKMLSPNFAILIIYVFIYFGYKQISPGLYDGNKIHEFSFLNFLKTGFQLSFSSAPTYLYWHMKDLFSHYSDFFDGHKHNLFYILKNSKPEWIIKSLLCTFVTFKIVNFKKFELSNRKYFAFLASSLLLFLLPVVLISLTSKYQDWVLKYGGLQYTVTYFSYLGTILFISCSLFFLKSRIKNIIIYLSINIFIGFFIFLGTLLTDYSNHHVIKSQIQSQYKWNIFDRFINADEFKQMPDGSVVYAASLWGDIGYPESYWTEYVKQKTGKEILFLKNGNEFWNKYNGKNFDNLNVYFLKYSQEIKDGNQFIVFSKINMASYSIEKDSFYSDKAHIYYLSKFKNFTVFFNSDNRDGKKNLLVNDYLVGKYTDRICSFIVNGGVSVKGLTHVKFEFPNIDLGNISISNFLDFNMPSSDVVPIFLGDFSVLETNGVRDWRWCGNKGLLVLENRSLKQKQINFNMYIKTGYPGISKMVVSSNTFKEILEVTENEVLFEQFVSIPPKGVIEIEFLCDAPQIHAPSDPRVLVFGVLDFNIEDIN